MENRRKWAVGYAVLCILYFAVSVLMPHDRLESRGLEGIGKPSLKLKTEAITDKTELRFEYLTDAQALSQLSFYFTADGGVLTRGEIEIAAYDSDTQELLADAVYELKDLGAEGFWGVDFENEPVNQAITVVITGKNIEEGPYIWLNTETETAGTSYEDGQALEKNLIFNAVYRTQVHYVKKPFLTTLMLALLGAMFFLVAGGTEKEETGRRLRPAGKSWRSFRRPQRDSSGDIRSFWGSGCCSLSRRFCSCTCTTYRSGKP